MRFNFPSSAESLNSASNELQRKDKKNKFVQRIQSRCWNSNSNGKWNIFNYLAPVDPSVAVNPYVVAQDCVVAATLVVAEVDDFAMRLVVVREFELDLSAEVEVVAPDAAIVP